MSDQTIFGNVPNPAETLPNNDGSGTPSNVPNDSGLANLLAEIKNERGEPKYKNVQDALVALKHSQTYIPQLTTEVRERDAELANARARLAEIDELKRTVQALTQRQTDPAPQGPQLDEGKIADLVSSAITQREAQTRAQQNAAQVANALRSKYGAEAEVKYNEKAAELGIDVAELNALASKSPAAALRLLGEVDIKPQSSGLPTPSSIRTDGIQPHQESLIGRNKHSTQLGATTQDIANEAQRAAQMVVELEKLGLSVDDLSNPKVYAKYFGK